MLRHFKMKSHNQKIVLFVICSLLISGFVVGSVVGGIGVAVVAIIVIIFLRKRRRGKNNSFYEN